ncbi:MAG: ArnT family glycosyltransferase [Longimicrobiales bacterium]
MAFVRLVRLASWPAVQADEGLWTNATKNFVAFGDWFMDGSTHLFLSPIFHLLSLPAFSVFGSSITSARLVSAVAGLASIALLYLTVQRLTNNNALAMTTAIVFAVDEWTVLVSRTALIESVELAVILLAAYFLSKRTTVNLVLAGLALALALLTKLNSVFMLPVFALFLLTDSRTQTPHIGRTALRVLLVGGMATLCAGLMYYLLYRVDPQRFVNAFRFELDGVHFESISRPLLRVGRFGLDPSTAATTMMELFRESPFLWVLGALGFGHQCFERPRRMPLFGLWFVVGFSFFLLQMYQPTRYFYLITPAVAFFAACAILRIADPYWVRRGRVAGHGALATATFVAFSLAYIAGGHASNSENRLPLIVQWVERETLPTDRIMASGFVATDLKRRAYAHYKFARSEEELLGSVRQLEIDFIVFDNAEWSPKQRAWLDAHYEVVQRWPFGAVYHVAGPPPVSPSGAPAP